MVCDFSFLRMYFGYSKKKFLISIKHSEKSDRWHQIRTTTIWGIQGSNCAATSVEFCTNLHFTTDLSSHFGEPRPSSGFVGFQTNFLCDLHPHGDSSSSSPKWIWNWDERVVRPVRNLLPVVHVLISLLSARPSYPNETLDLIRSKLPAGQGPYNIIE